MRNAITAFAIVALVISAFALYAITYDTGRLNVAVSQLAEKVAATQAEIAAARAQRASLTRPARIEPLAQANLKLHPLLPNQLGTVADLPWRENAPVVVRDAPPVALQADESQEGVPQP